MVMRQITNCATQTSILTEHLIAHDARMAPSPDKLDSMSSSDALTAYMVVPHDKPAKAFKGKTPLSGSCSLVTEWWIERCLHRKRLVDPDQDVTSRPFADFPIEGQPRLEEDPLTAD